MSNFNQRPILVTGPMAQSFWSTLQSLGLLPAGQGRPITVRKIVWNDPGGGGQFMITDGSLSQNPLKFGDTPPDFVGADVQYDMPNIRWRDWQVTELQGGTLEIFCS